MYLSSSSNSCGAIGDPCTCSGTSNIVWQNTAGQLAIWTMREATIKAHAYPGQVGADWQIKGTGDFDGDGEGDILWRHNTGQVAIWYMHDGSIASQAYPGGPDPGLTWKIEGTGDFDGDTRADILWRHTNGQIAIWMMSGGTRIDEAHPGGLDPTQFWKVQGVGDFDGNLKSDILWRSNNGLLALWFDGVERFDTLTYQNLPGNLEASWQLQAIADFNHDGRDDILWRGANGQPSLWLVDGARFVGDVYPPWVDNGWQIKGLLHDY